MIVILCFPGTNCEKDVQYAYTQILHEESIIIPHTFLELPNQTDLVIIPGGFSYGDYLRSGAIARFGPIMKSVIKYAQNGGKILGICNGFQILTEARLLPGALKRNKNLCFISKNQNLEVFNTDNDLLSSYNKSQIISMPIAHADGNYYVDEETLENMKDNHQILLKYQDNPNGSIDSIAGICNKEKNVFGLMPHPERAIENLIGGIDGINMLNGLIKK